MDSEDEEFEADVDYDDVRETFRTHFSLFCDDDRKPMFVSCAILIALSSPTRSSVVMIKTCGPG
jgi:hypothetical protein